MEDGVYIPSNLTIFATMNSSDQSVFSLDTAFKRRWSFEQISNKFDASHPYKDHYVPGTNVTWEVFVNKINAEILKNSIYNSTNEDKRLGMFFVSKDCLTKVPEQNTYTSQQFAYKVLEYIWNDVCRVGREDWFDTEKYQTLEDLIEAFVTLGAPLSIFKNMSFGEE